jgi:hypothetical protein
METLSQISKKWCSPSLSDKGTTHSYIEYYEKWFDSFRSLPITLLEVGVKSGASIRMWNDYFVSEKKKIIGVDIVLGRPYQVDLNFENIQLFQGSATNEIFMSQFKDIDIFIDDGSHNFEDQIATMKMMLPKIKAGGLYVIEDVGYNSEGLVNEQVIDKFKDLQLNGQGELFDLRSERPDCFASCNSLFIVRL